MADPRRNAPSLVLALVAALVGCHECGHQEDIGWGGPLVGSPCKHDKDCFERCVGGGDFPHGTCTVDCGDDGDCPGGTVCVNRAGGVCLLPCAHDDDCRPEYDCNDTPRPGGGDTLACIH